MSSVESVTTNSGLVVRGAKWRSIPYDFLFLIAFMYVKVLYLFFGVVHLWAEWETLMCNLGGIIILTGWTLLLRPNARIIALIVIDLILSSLMLADSLYFRYFSDLISIPVLVEFFQLNEIGGSVLALIKPSDLLFLIDFVIAAPFFVYSVRRIGAPVVLYRFSTRLTWAVALTVISLTPFAYQVRVIEETTPALLTSVYSHTAVANQLGILGYHVNDVTRYVDDYVLHGKRVSDSRQKQITAWFNDHQNQTAAPNPLFGVAQGDNIITIQMESIQEWVVNKKINGHEITPNLNKFLKRSMYFPNYYRQTAGGRTADAEFLSLNSLYPVESGVVYFRYVTNQYNSLPYILDQHGYSSAAMVAFSPIFWNREAMYKTEGFQTFYSYNNYKIDETFGLGLTDESFFKQSLPKLEQAKKPFFSFLITLSSHGPFDIPDKYQTMDIGTLKGTYIGNYIESVHYMDAALGNFLNQLKASGLMDHSVIAMYGDHDSGIPTNDPNYDQVMGLGPDDTLGWYEQMKVPLMIHLPNDAHAGVISQTRGELDLTPTLLHLVGIPTTGMPMMGQDVTNKANDLVVFRDHSFTDGRYFFITRDSTFEHGTCYDMKTDAVVDKSIVADEYKQAQERLSMSDDILDGNLIPSIMKNMQK